MQFDLLEFRHLLANMIVAENLLPGNPASEWDIAGIGDRSIQGYATDISVNQGETVNFKVDVPSLAPFRMDIYRMGYYGGDGARKVDSVPSTATISRAQPTPLTDPLTGLIDAGNWTVSASWNVPANATSGVYIARLVRGDTNGASHVIFIVRDDDGGSDILFQTADTTWQAYNNWGGNSLYTGPINGRSYAVSYNRPFETRATTAKDWFFSGEYATVRFLEKNGYDVSYFTGVDSDRYGSEILEHDVFLSVGHDEYWSGDQRANVEAARDSGVDLAFFSGNEVYWKTRWESSIDSSGTPYRTLISYKETWANAKIDPATNVWTGTWRDDRFSPPADGGKPENALTGQIFTVNRGPGGETGTPFTVGEEFSDLRFWRNTRVADLQPGETATIGDYVLGYEWDEDLDNGFRPDGLFQMSSTTQVVPQKIDQYGGPITSVGTATHSLTLYRAESGALVFGAGTVNWGWGLDGKHDVVSSTPDPAIQQAVVNLFADMGVQPKTLQFGLVYATISTDLVAPTSTISISGGSGTLQAGVPVSIVGTATDSGGAISAVEVSVDGGLSWRRAVGKGNWTYSWTPSVVGPTTIHSRAVDDSANIQIATASVAATVQLTPTSSAGLVAAYGFNNGSGSVLTDGSGNNNQGTISGAVFVPGFSGNALSFDGINDIVTIADSNSLDLTAGMTLEAWVRPADLDGWSSVIFKESTAGLSYALYASDNTSNPPAGYVNVGGEQSVDGISPLQLNAWSHVTVTYDSSFLRLYVNGVLASQTNLTGNIATSNQPLQIGGNTSFANEYFRGLIDEVRVYNRALNQSEIYYNMSTPVSGSTDSVAPTATIVSPTAGANVSNVIAINVSAADNIAVGSVRLFLNGNLLSHDSTFPYVTNLDTRTLTNGNYTLSGQVTDVVGNFSAIANRTIQVTNPLDGTPPTVKLLTPKEGQRISGTTALTAFANDNVGVVGVKFQVNGVNVGGEDLTQPYGIAWNSTTVADGSYLITAISRDAANNSSSESIQIVVDNTVPSVVSVSPGNGESNVVISSQVVVTLDEAIRWTTADLKLRNSQGQLVSATVNYDAGLFKFTLTPAQNLQSSETYTVSFSNIEDLAGNAKIVADWTFTTSASISNASVWPNQTTPAIASANDSSAVELGMRFQSTTNGFISGLKFYKGAANTGAHIGKLWTNTGSLLGSVTFTSETATGWQEASFNTPIQITANTSYVISYFAPNGGYSVDSAYFANSYSSGPFIVGINGGLYLYSANGGFPSNSHNSSNYWVDVRFSTSGNDVVAPTVSSNSPIANATGVATNVSPQVVFSESVQEPSISFQLRDPSQNLVAATVTYNDTTRQATLVPNSSLANLTTYTATVNGAMDAAGNVMNSYAWSFTTASAADVTPPVLTSRSPLASATSVSTGTNVTATFNEAIQPGTISFALTSGGQSIPSVVSYDNGTFTATLNPTNDLSLNTNYSAAITVQDLSGNSTTENWTFTTVANLNDVSIWNNSTLPSVTSANDTGAVELGVKFRAASDGYITGLKFYKGSLNTGTHVGNIWLTNGTRLATATFSGETSNGWQEVQFSNAIPVTANTTYVASYYAPNGGYAYNGNYFGGGTFVNGVLSALGNGVEGGNGLYRYGAGGVMPSQSFNATNYWVDVLYSSSVTDGTAPTVTSQSPLSNSTNIAITSNVQAIFSEPVLSNSIAFSLRDSSNNVVGATVSYNSSNQTVTLTPGTSLNYSTVYTATLSGARDAAGNVMSPISWSYTTAAFVSGSSIWNLQTSPAVASANDTGSVELGVKFRSTTAGNITSLRFYKGALNTGTHVGNFWASNGTLLRSATFTGETSSGWQQVEFSSPISITANTTYVASYLAPNGGYAFNQSYFASGSYINGGLTALGNGVEGGNGVYRYGNGGVIPTQSYNSTNYWVDIVFEASQSFSAFATRETEDLSVVLPFVLAPTTMVQPVVATASSFNSLDEKLPNDKKLRDEMSTDRNSKQSLLEVKPTWSDVLTNSYLDEKRTAAKLNAAAVGKSILLQNQFSKLDGEFSSFEYLFDDVIKRPSLGR